MKSVVLAVLLASVSMPALAGVEADAVVTPVTVTALPGAELDARDAAAPVQTATAADIDASHALDLTDFLRRTAGAVYVNDIQNNPLQPDVNYRGFTASPLLGTAQGLSVYADGVRLNQPFGDVVSWDLIPTAAIASLELAPGSNPLFGRNTLGGALVLRTKDGRGAPGVGVEAGYGSFGRWQATAEAGGEAGDFNWYGVVNRLAEDGWRDFSPTDAAQGFGKLGWSDGATDVSVSGALAVTDLTGNALQEQRLLERDRASVYTKPDNTKNQSAMLNLVGSHKLSDAITLSGDAFWRRVKTKTLNGDLNDEALTEAVYQPSAAERAALAAAGYTGFPTAGETAANTPFPSWRCIANGLLNSEPGEKCNGLLNRGQIDQSETGFTVQSAWTGDWDGVESQLVIGGGYVSSKAHFLQSTQYGYLTPDRGVVGISGRGAFADGSQNSENAEDARVDLTGETRTVSAYGSDRITLSPTVALTVSARFDRTEVHNKDALLPNGGPGSLNGKHHFQRLNPAVSLVWDATTALTVYGGYSEGSRAPSAIELGCADPDNPCRLPNAMAGDPPLNQVVTKTIEVGARGDLAGWRWNAGLFRADNHDDILFVADDTSGFGYFANFGQTRRQGLEFGLEGDFGAVTLGGHYTWLDATYQSAEEVGGAGNSSNDIAPGFEGNIDIDPGDRIPLVPQNIFKADLTWAVTPTVSLNADVSAVSGVIARGNENGEHKADGVYYLGPGETDGYALLNLGGEWRPTERVRLAVQVNNLFDTEYETAAQLGATGFTDTGAFIARPFASPVIDGERPVRSATFYAPGAPRTAWVSLKYRF